MKWNVTKHGKQRILKDEKKQTAVILTLEAQTPVIEYQGKTYSVQVERQAHTISLKLVPMGEGNLIWNGKEDGIWALRPPVYEQAEIRFGDFIGQLCCRGVRCQIEKAGPVIGHLQTHQIEMEESDPLLAAFLMLVFSRMIEEKDIMLV